MRLSGFFSNLQFLFCFFLCSASVFLPTRGRFPDTRNPHQGCASARRLLGILRWILLQQVWNEGNAVGRTFSNCRSTTGWVFNFSCIQFAFKRSDLIWVSDSASTMGPGRICHYSRLFAAQSSHFMDKARWQAKNSFHWFLDTMS